jgi:hypothetical protein
MDIENKFMVRGKVSKTYTREIETKNGGKFTEYYVVLEIECMDSRTNVAILYRDPQNVNEGDEVEARGFLVSRYAEKTGSWFNSIRGKSLTVLQANTPNRPINAPLRSKQPIAPITTDNDEDVPF